MRPRLPFILPLALLILTIGIALLPRLKKSGTLSMQASAAGEAKAFSSASQTAVIDPAARDSRSSDEALDRFDDWLGRFLSAAPADRSALIEEGLALAQERRPAFKDLIRLDPGQALARAVPMVARQKLPASINALLERRVNHVGTLRTYHGCPDPDAIDSAFTQSGPTLKRVAELKDDLTYAARVFGRRASTTDWEAGVSVNGVALDSEFAVANERARLLEAGETPNAAKPLVTFCPDQGTKPLGALPENATAYESALEVAVMCDCHDHAAGAYDDTIRLAEGATGGPLDFTGILPAAPTPSLGVVRVLYMPVTYADQNAIPVTEARAYQTMRDVSDYYAKGSYGKLTLLCTVTPPVKLPHNEAWYVQQDTANGGNIDGEGMSHRHARDEARKLGFDTNDYDTHIMRHTGGPGSYGGLAGGSTVWIRGDGAGLSGHEIGHTFGLPHANFWDTGGTSSIGAGINAEYGHPYDIMGSSGAFPAGHYNAQGKSRIRWLPDSFVRLVTQPGTYRIHAFDQPSLIPSRSYALNLIKDAQRVYWLESRTLFNTNPWITNGAMLGWRFPSGGANNLQLIDTTPGSPFAKEDAPIALGQTFSDREAGIHITTVGVNENPHSVDVLVNFGRFESNQNPSLTLAASSEVVPVNGTVTFTATATDPDGDPLAYSWQHFGLTSYKVVEPNSPVITRTFPTAGTYVVACTVSDMKGGSSTRWKLVTVGNGGSRYTISGRITQLGAGVPDVVITANGANGVVTDDDGFFTIPNLSSNTYTLTPLLYGFTFSEQFNNSITVAPNFEGAFFEAEPAPSVTLTASEPSAAENPVTAGRFTLARTGDTALPLVVNVNTAQGTATLTSDYAFNPAYVAGSQGYQNFTIPGGAATLDIHVTPVDDTAAEGPETVILQIAPATGYVVSGAAEAQVVIDDNDTSLPRVALERLAQFVKESDAATPVVRFRRTGSTAAPLTVSYSVGGTATAVSDFAALSGSVSIPIGAASVDLDLTPVNNAVSESLETVVLNLAVSGAYVIDPTANSASIDLIDDDVQTVTVTATDAAAAEVDLTVPGALADTGTFLISREGDTSQPLTVYYSLSGTISGGVPALHGLDFEALPGVLVIPAGETRASVTLVPRHDGIGEGPENVVLQLGAGPTNYILGEPSAAEVVIADHPADRPIVDVIATQRVIENTTNGNFRISARGAGTGVLTVNYTISGTATAGTDYNISGLNTTTLQGSVNLTLNNGEAVLSNLAITRINDAIAEPLEDVTLTINPDPAYQTFAPTASATTWIQDDDQNTVFVDAQVGTSTGPANAITEGATTSPVRFYISRTGSTSAALTVTYTLSGTATSGSDYTAPSGSVTIPAGALGTSVNLSIINDTTFEGTETIVFDVSPGSYAVGTTGAMIYINDNETTTQRVQFTADGSVFSEAAGSVSVPVSLTSIASTPITVEYLPDSGTLGTSTFNGANVKAPYWLRLVRSGNVFQAYQSANGTSWSQFGGNQTLTMAPEMLVGLAVSARGDGLVATATFDNVTVSPAPSEPLRGRSIGYVQVQGTDAESGGTYTLTGSGAGIGVSNQDECHFLSAPLSGNFTLTARLASLTGGDVDSEAGLMARESTGWRHRSVSAVSQANSTLKLRRRAASVTTALGQGIDHDLTPGVLLFNVGEQTKNITLNLTDDDVNEPNDTLVIRLLNPRGALLGTTLTNHVLTILDDDDGITTPHVAFASATQSAAEASGAVAIPVSLSTTSDTPVSIDYAVTGGDASFGGDHTLVAGTLNFPPGSTVNVIPLPLVDDGAIEPAETLVLSLSNPVGCQLSSLNAMTFTILDDDLPSVTVVSADDSASENGPDPASVTFSRTGPTTSDLTVEFALSGTATTGSDYVNPGTSVVIPAGEAEVTLPLTPVDDSSNEGAESIIVTVASTANYTVGNPDAATVTLLDNDRSTVAIVASDPDASETPGNTGEFTFTRTAPTTSSLTVNLTRTGTATSGSDYSGVGTSVTFNAGQDTRTITVTPLDDAITEGPEQVTLAINAGSYDIAGDGFANVTIQDNDSPPVIFINSPSAQGPLVAGTNGIIVSASVTDDGAPQPVSIEWSQISGPGTAAFDTPASAECPVSFDTPGTYVLQIAATDGQFTVRDQISVAVGAALTPAPWISQDTLPISSRRGQGLVQNGVFTLSATGSGLTARTNDQLHVVARQVAGDASLIVRLNSVTGGSSPFAGILLRKTLDRREIRCALGWRNGALEFRTRSTPTTQDSAVTVAGVSLPVWLRLERDATAQTITASYAPDNSGAPGSWTSIGSPSNLALNDLAIAALGAYSGSTANTTTAEFDNVTLTPAPAGPALLTDHLGLGSTGPGTFSESGGVYTIGGSGGIDGGGSFHGWQFTGDLVITAKHVNATSSAGSAKSGIMIRESMDSGGYVHFGRIQTGAFSGYIWRSVAGGSGGGLPTFNAKTRWIRLVRQGNSITAFHAPDAAGAPGTWIQVGQPQTIVMTPNVLVGFAVDNASGVGLNTVTFSDLTIEPLNRAPLIAASVSNPAISPVPLNGNVTDDNFPAPPAVAIQWSRLNGPGALLFGNPALAATTATLDADGAQTLRLRADDGSAESFFDLAFDGYASPTTYWQASNYTGGSGNPAAAMLHDSDFDGLLNLLEYALGTSPHEHGPSHVNLDEVEFEGQRYLRLTLIKNPMATDVTLTVQGTSDLSNPASWDSAGLIIEEDTATTLRVRDSVPMSPGTRRFLRGRVTQP